MDTPRVGLRDVLRWIAYAGMAVAAVSTRSDARGAAGIACATILVWACEIRAAAIGGPKPARVDVRFVGGTLAAFVLLDMLGVLGCSIPRFDLLALNFAATATFAVLGWLTAARRAPSDVMVLSQLVFHGATAGPALGFVVWLYLGAQHGWANVSGLDGPIVLVTQLYTVMTFILPSIGGFAIVCHLEQADSSARAGRPWQAILVGELCWTLNHALSDTGVRF